MSREMLLEIVVVLLVVVLVMLLLLQLQIVQKVAHGNSSTASKLQTARNIAISGAVKGSANFDGSGNVTINTTQANIAVISGKVTLNANTNDNFSENKCTMTDVSLNYPTGFSMNNCVVICVGINYNSAGYYDFGWTNHLDTLQFARGLRPYEVTLNNAKINLSIGNLMASENMVNYKIVLMKI